MFKKVSIYVCVFVLLAFNVFSTSVAFADDDIPVVQDTPVVTNTEVTQLRISANQTTGLHSVMLQLIGDYNPIVKDYTYTSSNGYTSHSIDIQPDWSWIASCAVFIVVLYSVFRLIGGIFSNR